MRFFWDKYPVDGHGDICVSHQTKAAHRYRLEDVFGWAKEALFTEDYRYYHYAHKVSKGDLRGTMN